ncbi:MAG: phosphoribosylformylglycinamidine cyclo-ligase, partial [Burkholderiaceae bacterium]|nr:phosphoribosylformylglycinamidine cyclo-ligase [Burkholderiaceae bacterium]
LAGFAVGAVEKSRILTGQAVQAGDAVLGLASSGVHSNGFSLVRKCIERAFGQLPQTLDGQPFQQAVMAPTRIYVKSVLAALNQHGGAIHALAHITGGGLTDNIPRVLPAHLAARLTRARWPQSELFAWLAQTAGISDAEMNRTFNNGIGMVAVVAPDAADAVIATLSAHGETVYRIGAIAERGAGQAVIVI